MEGLRADREIGWVASVPGRASGEDRALLRRISRGDERALEDLYARHGGALFGYLLLLSPGDRGLAEEVLQDTLVAAWRGAGGFRGASSAKTWLFGIGRRRMRDASRRRGLPPLDGEGLLEALPAREPGPEEALSRSESGAELERCIGQLSQPQREALALVFFHELTYAEAAEVLGVPVGTVKSRLSNAKRALRGLLEEGE
jgi:RNA polymerase sigma-70 factor (ECF subfamily)